MVYLQPCKVCGKQYVVSATKRLRVQKNDYKDNQRKAKRGEEHLQEYFHEHLPYEGHNAFNQSWYWGYFIDKADPLNPTRREKFWNTKLLILTPEGLNKKK